VVIVNWNSGELLQECLFALNRQTLRPDHIFIIDNASSDGSASKINKQDNLSILSMDTNLGFAEGNNHAFQFCNTEYVALLNPDAFPEPDWLENLLAAAVLYPNVAAFGSSQLCANHPELLDGIGDNYHISGLVWREGHGEKLLASGLVTRQIFSSCAAAALYRRDALLAVGGFDSDYFCYVEDVDLGFRLRLAGYKAMHVPNAVVNHVGSVTTGGQHSDFSVYHGHRNLVWTYIKDMPGFLFWAFLPLHLVLNLVSLLWFLARGQGRVIFRAKWDAINGIPSMWRKRKLIQSARIATYGEILGMMDKRLFLWKRRAQ